jgi:MoaA/NifB/PqqE/SkfB family radical SAM enzyme
MYHHSPTGISPVLQVHPSRLCNIACAHCYSLSGPGAREEIAWDILSTCIEDAADLGYEQMAVSGGEPLLYKPLDTLLSHAKKHGMVTTLTSNGMLLKQDRWEPLAPFVDIVAISMDGTAPEHDQMRGLAGAFDRTVGNLHVLQSSKVPYGFIFTLTQYNVDSLEFVVRLAAEHGARSVQVHPLTLHGRAKRLLPSARPDTTELLVALMEARRLGEDLGVKVHVDAITSSQLLQYHDYVVPERPVKQLSTIAPVLIVRANAEVLPLTHEVDAALTLGSLHTACLSRLAEAWMSAGHGDTLAAACEQTWNDLTRSTEEMAFYWYEEVAMRTKKYAKLPTVISDDAINREPLSGLVSVSKRPD